jgi:galactose-1-phosphate uridylyltransferase
MSEPKQQFTKTLASQLIQSYSIENLSSNQLLELFQAENELRQFIPEKVGQIDPRTDERVMFNLSRATRPNADSQSEMVSSCPICAGRTTQILDYVELSSGFTFVNKNLYPAIFPHAKRDNYRPGSTSFPAWGMHFLQWTSSFHDRDWHNMEIVDLSIVMSRLGAMEQHLLETFSHLSDQCSVSIIKNGGLGSGGSLRHGHQQIIFSTVLPRRIVENKKFEQNNGEPFSKFILDENPSTLVIQDFGEAILLVPYFMRRPYNMLLIVKDTSKKNIYQLSFSELSAVSQGWKTAISAIHQIMTLPNKTISYNVLVHNGSGLYFEFLPRTQTEGGFELIGLSVCQSEPYTAADQIREVIQTI